MELSQNVYDKQNTLHALNMVVVAVTHIASGADRFELEQQYRTIISRLKIGSIKDDDEIVELYTNLMSANTSVQLLEKERERFLRVYDREQKRAVFEALKGPLTALPLMGAFSWLALGRTLLRGANAFFGYRAVKERLHHELEAGLWQLEREKRQAIDAVQQKLLSSAWHLLNRYGLSDEARVKPDDLVPFEKALKQPDLTAALSIFAEMEQKKQLSAYPPFWFYYGETALQNGDAQKAEKCFEQFDRTDRDVLYKDAYKVQIAKERIAMNRGDRDYVRRQLAVMWKHIDDEQWLDYLFYGVVSFAIGEKQQALRAVHHNISHGLEKELSGAVLKAIEEGVQYLWAALARAFYAGKGVAVDKRCAYKYASLAKLCGDKSVDDLLEKLEGTSGFFGKKAELSEAERQAARAEAQTYYDNERNSEKAALAAENARLQNAANQMEEVRRQASEATVKLQKDLDDARQEIDRQKNAAAQSDKARQTAEALRDEWKNKYDDLKSEFESMKMAFSNAQSGAEITPAQYAELQGQLKAAETVRDDLRTKLADFAGIQWKYEGLTKDHQELQKRAEKLDRTVEELQTQLAELRDKLTAANEEIGRLREENAHLESEKQAAEERITELENDLRVACGEEERLSKTAKNVTVGGIVTFGQYEQEDVFFHEKDPIEWIVLAKHKGRYLLISKYGLDCKPYHHEKTDITWENCDLRKWLNDDFINAAFTKEEQNKIQQVTIHNPNNATFGTPGGNPTRDKVFLLSLYEAKRLFKNDETRICKSTTYAKDQGAKAKDDSGNCWWWLRSPCVFLDCLPEFVSGTAEVSCDGSVGDDVGSFVNMGSCVRPALWVSNL